MKLRISMEDHSRLVELCKSHDLGVGEAVRRLVRQFDGSHDVASLKNKKSLHPIEVVRDVATFKKLNSLHPMPVNEDVATFQKMKSATSIGSMVMTIDGLERLPALVRQAISWGIRQARNQEAKPKMPIEAEGIMGVDCVMEDGEDDGE